MAHDSDSSTGSPPLSPATETRFNWDAYHYRGREHELLSPDIVSCNDNNQNEITFERPRSRTENTRTVQDLSPDDCRLYCFRDCVLYLNSPVSPRSSTADRLGQTVWIEWFPHRDMNRDVADGSFFCRYMGFRSQGELKDIVYFHQALCERIHSQEAAIERPDIPKFSTLGVEQEVPFRLRLTFPSMFLVVDKTDWKQHGVLVVCKDTNIAAAFGGDKQSSILPIPQTSWVSFRAKLAEAMSFIFSQYPDRGSQSNSRGYFYENFASFGW